MTGPRLDEQLCFALYAASNSVVRAYRPGLAALGLTYPQYLVMMVLWERDGVTVQQLGERLQQAPHGLTPVLHRLVASGFVTRSTDPADGRVTRVYLTEAGRDLARAASAAQADVACRTGLDTVEYAALRDTLQRLARTTAGSESPLGRDTQAGPAAGRLATVAGSLLSLLQSASVAAYVIDADGSVAAVSPSGSTFLGWPAEELVGRPAHATLHHADERGAPAALDTCPIQTAQHGERVTRADHDTFWRRDGSPVTVWWTAMPLPDPATGVVRTLVVFDRTEGRDQDGEAASARVDIDTRLLVLGQLSELLGITDVAEGLHRVAALGASTLADWCVIDRLDDHRVTRAAIADRLHSQRELDQRLRVMPALRAQSTGSLGRVLRGADTVAVDIFDHGRSLVATAASDPLDVEQARLFADLGAAHAFVVPLRARDQVLGAMTWVRTDPARPFTDTDILLATVFGFRVGLWLDNARLYTLQRTFAETVQRSLLTALPEPDHLHVVARYAPAMDGMQVGGDWYDALFTHQRNLALTVGDVTGHDSDAAARMSQIRTMLRFALLDDPTRPQTALARVDAAMPTLAISGQATAVVAVIDQHDDDRSTSMRRLTWTNAGHLPPLLLDPTGEPRLLDTSPDLLLGVRAGTPRHTHTVTVEPHSTLLLFTDGLVERRDATLDHGLARLVATARELAALPLTLDEFCDELLDQLAPPGQRDDDIALVAVRFHPEDRDRPAEAGPELLPPDQRHALPTLDPDVVDSSNLDRPQRLPFASEDRRG